MSIDKKYPELRPWDKLVGISGDLADVIVGVLSWVSVSHGVSIIRISDFYTLFIRLSGELPDSIQELNAVTHKGAMGSFTFSTRLCDSLENALQLGIRMSGDGQHLEIFTPVCRNNLERLRKRVGEAFVNNLRPISDRFAKLLKK